jgi:hypothetical protein
VWDWDILWFFLFFISISSREKCRFETRTFPILVQAHPACLAALVCSVAPYGIHALLFCCQYDRGFFLWPMGMRQYATIKTDYTFEV